MSRFTTFALALTGLLGLFGGSAHAGPVEIGANATRVARGQASEVRAKFLLNGQRVRGVKVAAYEQVGSRGLRKLGDFTTDGNGMIRFSYPVPRNAGADNIKIHFSTAGNGGAFPEKWSHVAVPIGR